MQEEVKAVESSPAEPLAEEPKEAKIEEVSTSVEEPSVPVVSSQNADILYFSSREFILSIRC